MQLFVDMDGVLADFDRHHETGFGVRSDKLTDNVDWAAVGAVKDYYLSIPPMADLALLWGRIERYRPIISFRAMHARRPEDSCAHFGAGTAGSARFALLGEPFHGANGPSGLGGLRFVALLLSEQLLGLLAVELIDAVALHVRIEHFQGPTAGVDLVVMGEIGEPFEDTEQVLVPEAAQDLHIANTALRAERPESRGLVATLAR